MPIIKPCADLRNNYNEISKICHETKNPVFITKNGYNDLVILSKESYEKIIQTKEKEIEKLIEKKFDEKYTDFEKFKLDIIKKINQGLKDIEKGNYTEFKNLCQEMEAKYDFD